MSSAKTVAKNTIFMFSSEIISNIFMFFFLIFAVRLLGDAEFGKYSFAFAFIGFLIIFSDFGISPFIVREVSKNKKLTEKYFGNGLSLKLLFLLLTGLLAVIIINLTETRQDVILMVYLASAATLIIYLAFYYRTLIYSYQIMEYEAVLKFIEKFLIFLIGIFVLVKTKSVIALLVVFVAVYAFSLLLHFFIINSKIKKIKKILPKLDFKLWKKLFKHGLPFWVTWLFFSLFFRIDTIMLKYLTSYSVVGWYNAAYKLIEGLSFIPSVFIVVVFPAMSYWHSKNKKNLGLLYKKAFRYLAIIVFPMALGATMLADRIILFLYKESFIASVLVLKILIWAEAFLFLNYLIGTLLNSINKQKLFAYSTGFCVFINIILNLMLIPKLSYVGACISTLLSQAINFIILYYFASKQGHSINLKKIIFKPIIATTLMGILIFFIYSLHIFIIIPLAVILYFLILFILKEIGREEINLIKSSLKKAK